MSNPMTRKFKTSKEAWKKRRIQPANKIVIIAYLHSQAPIFQNYNTTIQKIFSKI